MKGKHIMKKRITQIMLASVIMIFSLAGCGSGETKNEKISLTVFAAASMTETLEEIKQLYIKENPNVDITFNFDSSGTLKTQIEEGAECDLFISAAQKQMDELDASDKIEKDTRCDILENKVTLVVPDNNKKNINSYDDMVRHLKSKDILMSMGNEDVPVGQYTQKILNYYGLDEKALADDGLITYGSNVKEVTTQVSEGAVDCGVIYSTDAFSAGLTVVDTATEEMCGKAVYPASVLKGASNYEQAKAFLDFIKNDASSKVFEKVGFTVIK